VTVFVVADIPLAVQDGDVASYDLTAQTAVGGVASNQGADITSDDFGVGDNPASVQTVFADGAGTTDGGTDGRHSSKDAYKVASASLTVDKAAAVTNDPINGGTNPKAIPGATMDYTIDVDNNGTVPADGVELIDSIPANTSFLVGSVSTAPAATVEYSDDNGATWTYVPVAGGDGSDPNVTHLRVTFASIAGGGGNGSVGFQVLIL
jgi:uncharacterized repeat protein (TIGR01451 family)